MSDMLQFDYFYGNEAEQFAFFRIPKLLITDERFKGLSSDAKLLYGMLLDRMCLSMKNNWLDDQNRAYIIYTIESIAEDLGCGRDKAIKTLAELDSEKGIGLIEKKRRGFGQPAIIYVKNFSSINEIENKSEYDNQEDEKQEKEAANPYNSYEVGNVDFKKSEMSTSRGRESRLQEVGNADFKRSEVSTSRDRKYRLQEVDKSDSNNTNYNNTDLSDNNKNETNLINPSSNAIPIILPEDYVSFCNADKMDETDALDSYYQIQNQIKENIGYQYLCKSYDFREVDELVDIMTEAVSSNARTIRVNGNDIPQTLIKKKFLEMDYDMVSYVLYCMNKVNTPIRNIKAYLIASLLNASMTISNFWSAEARKDLAGNGDS